MQEMSESVRSNRFLHKKGLYLKLGSTGLSAVKKACGLMLILINMGGKLSWKMDFFK